MVGIEASLSNNNPRLVFSLHTDRAPSRTTLKAHHRYQVGEWVHVAATYDGRAAKFYLNGAKVAVSGQQAGSLFASLSSGCKALYLGGEGKHGRLYRGTIDELRLWQGERTHKQIVQGMHKEWSSLEDTEALVVKDSFTDLDQWKRKNGIVLPALVQSDVRATKHDIEITPPRCGQTLCDDPTVVSSYAENWLLTAPKQVRLRIVNVMDDDGQNPTVGQEQIQLQEEALRRAFKPYNITWQWSVKEVRNTSLHAKTILFDCDPTSVGDTACDVNCQTEETGYDGGDCDLEWSVCNPDDVG